MTPIAHYETRNVMSSLGVSLTTLRRTVSLLRYTLTEDIFDKAEGERGYSEKTFYCLQLYFEFRKKGAGRLRAAEYVKQTILQQQQNVQSQSAQ